ncbi:MAG: hypothetical protein NT062_29015 [Proteobacteria bacterium]|nr:hypothetical protein [Pseudomonadota bacterium]
MKPANSRVTPDGPRSDVFIGGVVLLTLGLAALTLVLISGQFDHDLGARLLVLLTPPILVVLGIVMWRRWRRRGAIAAP